MKRIGLLAGIGRLPVEFARAACGMGFTVTAVALTSEVDAELKTVVTEYHEISIGQLESILAALTAAGVEEATLLGKVTKELLYSGQVAVDDRMKRLLGGLKDFSDDTLMLGFVKELAAAGIGVLDQTAFIRALLPAPGVLTRRQPTPQEAADMEFGLGMARAIGGLDIGQTVVVKDRAVMAVEAIEGTDACIRRGGQLGRGGVTVAKTAKPSQDSRFDVPAVGPDTLQAMIDAGAVALVIEAGKTLLVNRQRVIELADANNITIAVQ
ncbi:MAG: UDP-2,3-diacylglucosamine diphosphatase LpxI [Sporomusaceae bacterium]|nr:UDP-2,3-diacylglucosamine diphosphatase LpxI [Sporomusaceae bacterium]